jgi:hypothetical protein
MCLVASTGLLTGGAAVQYHRFNGSQGLKKEDKCKRAKLICYFVSKMAGSCRLQYRNISYSLPNPVSAQKKKHHKFVYITHLVAKPGITIPGILSRIRIFPSQVKKAPDTGSATKNLSRYF